MIPWIATGLAFALAMAFLCYRLNRYNKEAEQRERNEMMSRLDWKRIEDITRRKSERTGDWL